MAVAKPKPARDESGSVSVPTDYGTDIHAWALEQAALLRRLRPSGFDVDNLAEEIESVGRSERKEVLSRLGVLLLHLMKARYQPEKRKGGWDATILLQRRRLKKLLGESPSLRDLPAAQLSGEYDDIRIEAQLETGLPLTTFPEACPFTIEEILDDDFFG